MLKKTVFAGTRRDLGGFRWIMRACVNERAGGLEYSD